jgi:hypothetical protein
MMGWLRGSKGDGGEVVVLVVVNGLCRNWESCHRAIGASGAGQPHLNLQTQHQDAITNYNRHALTMCNTPRPLLEQARSFCHPALAVNSKE